MKVTLDDGRAVEFAFRVHPMRKGNNATACKVVVSTHDGSRPTDIAVSVAKCHPSDFYDRATGKAKALAGALGQILPSRTHRKRVWQRFYETLQTPDVRFLDGCEEYM